MLYLTNSFSVHMFGKLNVGDRVIQEMEIISKQEASYILRGENFRSFFGHIETAEELSRILGVTINQNRGLLQLKPYDRLIIATLQSKRLQGYNPEHWFSFWYVRFRIVKDTDRMIWEE